MAENQFDARTELEKEIKEFETRRVDIFEEIKKEQIAPEEFDSIQLQLKSELVEISGHILVKSERENWTKITQLFELSQNRVLSYMEKARAISVSKWKDKHPGILSTLASVFPKKVDFNNIEVEPK